MARPHSRHASYPLLHSRGGPRYVEMNHDFSVLQIHPFAQQVRTEKDIDRLCAGRRPDAICARCKTLDRFLTSEPATANPCSTRRKHCYSSLERDQPKEGTHCGKVLSKPDDLRSRIGATDVQQQA